MNPRSLPILVLALLVLAGVTYWAVRDGATPVQPGNETPLIAALGGSPDEIYLANGDKTKQYRFQIASTVRTEDGKPLPGNPDVWWLTDPFLDEANPAEIVKILGQLDAATKSPAWPDGKVTDARLEQAGLLRPHTTMTLGRGDGADSKTLRIEFGEETYPPGKQFARIGGEVYRIPFGIGQAIQNNDTDVRNPMLFHAAALSIRELEITRLEGGDKTGILLTRAGNGGFEVRASRGGEALPADPAGVGRLVASLLAARARRFLPKDAILPKPAPAPWLRVRIRASNLMQDEVLEVTDPNLGEVYATKTGRTVKFVVDGESFSSLIDLPVSRLISTRIWTFGPSMAARIQVIVERGKTQTLVLGRDPKAAGFRLEQPIRRGTNASVVNDLIAALERTVLRSVLSGEAASAASLALEQPEAVVRLEAPAARRIEPLTVRFRRGKDGKLLAKREGDASVFVVADQDYETFFRPWWSYVELVAFRYASHKSVSRIEVEIGGQTRVWELDAKGNWVRDGKVDDEFDELYSTLRALDASKVVGVDADAILAKKTQLGILRALGTNRVPLGTLALWRDGNDVLARAQGELPIYKIAHRQRSARILRDFFARLEK